MQLPYVLQKRPEKVSTTSPAFVYISPLGLLEPERAPAAPAAPTTASPEALAAFVKKDQKPKPDPNRPGRGVGKYSKLLLAFQISSMRSS